MDAELKAYTDSADSLGKTLKASKTANEAAISDLHEKRIAMHKAIEDHFSKAIAAAKTDAVPNIPPSMTDKITNS